jgi:hypothetical protein
MTESNIIDNSTLENYIEVKDKNNCMLVRNDTDYIMVSNSFFDDTNSSISSNVSSTMPQELGESNIKIKLDDTKKHISSGTPNSPKTSDTTISEKGETISKIRKSLSNKFIHYFNVMKSDIMVYYAEEQKYKFLHNVSFFDYGNVHPCDSFFEERGVQNPSFGERGVDSIIIGSIDLVRGTLLNNLQLCFGKLKAGETIIMFVATHTLDK